MDNFFTSFWSLEFLTFNSKQHQGFRHYAENRLGDFAILKKKAIDKFERGVIDYLTSAQNNLTVVAWKGNRSVYIASNCNKVEVLSQVQRWNRQKQAKVAIFRPFLINQYNTGIGGVDRADQVIGTYRIAIKTKKWWWAFFAWIPDTLLQNTWILYQIKGILMQI